MSKNNNADELKANVVKGPEINRDGQRPVVFSEQCGLGAVEKQNSVRYFDEELKRVESILGWKLTLGNIGMIVVDHRNEDNLSILDGSCAALTIHRKVDEGVITDGIVVIDMKTVSVFTSETITSEEAMRMKIRHELAHIMVANFAAQRGIDIHDPQLKLFSEPLAVWLEMAGDLSRLDGLGNEGLLEELSYDFPKKLEYMDMYNFLPSFWSTMAKENDDPRFPLTIFEELLKITKTLPPECGGGDEPETVDKMIVDWQSEVAKYTRFGESDGTFGGVLAIPDEVVSKLSNIIREKYGTFLTRDWKVWAAKLKTKNRRSR